MSDKQAAISSQISKLIAKKAAAAEAEAAAAKKKPANAAATKRTESDEEVLEAASEQDAEEEEEEGEEEEAAEGDEEAPMVVDDEEEEEERKEAPAKKPKKANPSTALMSHLDTEEDDETAWNTERDESAEAAAHAEALEQGSAKKKRRLQKLSDAPAAGTGSSYRLKQEDDDRDADFIDDDIGMFDQDDDFGVKRDTRLMESIQLQKAFQASSTPQEQGGTKKFLAFNAVGSIASTESRSSQTADVMIHIIEIQYADASRGKASKFRDFFNFHVAALGVHGAVFASRSDWDKSEKQEIPSTVFFRPSDTWDNQSSSEWQLQMDLAAKEQAELVAIGDTWVAVATNKQYVRLLSHSGIQRFILSLAGPCVTMVGQKDTLALVYHDGIPLPGHQNLGLIVMDVVKQREVYRGRCVISPRSKLTWIGWSDVGMLLTMDSHGVIRALSRNWDFQWTPVLDTSLLKKPGSSDSYWPIGSVDDKLQCVLLRGGARYPQVFPRPQLQAVSMQLPFLDLANENRVASSEEQHARAALLWYDNAHGGMNTASRWFTAKQETVQDKVILGLFQKACSLDRSSRALDLCTMLHKKKALEIASQLATLEKKPELVKRIAVLLSVKFPTIATTTAGGGAAGAAGRRGGDDDEGLSSFLDGPSAAPASKKGTLRRPAVSFDDAEMENVRGTADDGEAEYEIGGGGGRKASSLKRKEAPGSPSASTPASSFSSSLSRKTVPSANVKAKVAGAGALSQTPASSQATNPFAKKE